MNMKPYIFIVDDDSLVRQPLEKDFNENFSNSYLIESFLSGVEAFDAFQKLQNGSRLKLVLTDLDMPEMNGLELTKKLREEGYKDHIILQTAHHHEYSGREEEIGVSAVVRKDYGIILEKAKELLQL